MDIGNMVLRSRLILWLAVRCVVQIPPGLQMKNTFRAVLLCALSFSAISPLLASAQTGRCDAKRASLEKEIAYARAHGNAKRVDGLETALGQVNAHCTDASLRRDSERKIASAQKRLDEREKDLQEAKAQGKSAKKIADRQRKVDEAHADLERALIESHH